MPEREQAVSAGWGAFVIHKAATSTGGHIPDRLRNTHDALVGARHGRVPARSGGEMDQGRLLNSRSIPTARMER